LFKSGLHLAYDGPVHARRSPGGYSRKHCACTRAADIAGHVKAQAVKISRHIGCLIGPEKPMPFAGARRNQEVRPSRAIRGQARGRSCGPGSRHSRLPPRIRRLTSTRVRMTCMGLFLSSSRFGLLPFFVRSGKAVFRPVACDQVRGARGRGQGTETLAKA
jgi:hypothetical protein